MSTSRKAQEPGDFDAVKHGHEARAAAELWTSLSIDELSNVLRKTHTCVLHCIV